MEVDHLREVVSVQVDGASVLIPDDLEGIVVLNLPSYAGGLNLWGPNREEVFSTWNSTWIDADAII